MELMFQPLRKYADFQGRARRSEYWLFVLFIIIVEVVFYALVGLLGGFSNDGSSTGLGMLPSVILGLFGLAILVPSIAVGVRRLHDSDKSGWLILLGLIPFVGGLILLVLYCLDGTPGPNRFGPDPKGRGVATADVFS